MFEQPEYSPVHRPLDGLKWPARQCCSPGKSCKNPKTALDQIFIHCPAFSTEPTHSSTLHCADPSLENNCNFIGPVQCEQAYLIYVQREIETVGVGKAALAAYPTLDVDALASSPLHYTTLLFTRFSSTWVKCSDSVKVSVVLGISKVDVHIV